MAKQFIKGLETALMRIDSVSERLGKLERYGGSKTVEKSLASNHSTLSQKPQRIRNNFPQFPDCTNYATQMVNQPRKWEMENKNTKKRNDRKKQKHDHGTIVIQKTQFGMLIQLFIRNRKFIVGCWL
jgi:hypothetical protein